MWPSLEFASKMFNVCNVALVIGLVITAAATVAVIWAANQKEEYLNRELAESRERTAALEQQAGESRIAVAKANSDAAQSLERAAKAEANLASANARAEEATARSDEAKAESAKSFERATEAQKQVAAANARAAEANQKAEAERVERLRLELKLAPRSLSGAESQLLTRRVASLKGVDVDIVSYEGMGADVAALSMQIAEALINAGLNAKIFTPMGGAGVVRGILVRTEEGSPRDIEAAVDTLVSSIKTTGLDVGRWAPYPAGEPLSGAYNGPGSATAKLRVLVGGKP